MAPVVRQIEKHTDRFEHVLLATAQHREMLEQVLSVFEMRPDINLDLMQENQSLGDFASRAMKALSNSLAESRADAVLIEGDTTTVMVAAISAFYLGIPVGHVEAGLRSFDLRNPFPEEINRRIAGCVAQLHFAPTERARSNLLNEGVNPDNIFVTGNTIVDALQMIPLTGSFESRELDTIDFYGKRAVLVTAHRRENHGAPLRSICAALRRLAETVPALEIVYPVHLNPNVRQVVYQQLEGIGNVHLVSPISYTDLLKVMSVCFLILTDSGGIQEEAPSLHKPVLVLREVTERPEVIEAGAGKIVGTDTERIVAEVTRLLNDPSEYGRMSNVENPFGDGHAAEKIVAALEQRLC